MNHKGLLIIVSGPSGAGKGTICKELIRRDESIIVSVSATTRAPRNAEVDGKSYHFITKQMFESMIENSGFLEYAEVYDNYYEHQKIL
jgi:guanylate kinase